MAKGQFFKVLLVVLLCNVLLTAPMYIAKTLTDSIVILDIVRIACDITEIWFNIGMTKLFLMVFRGQQFRMDDFTGCFSLLAKGFLVMFISELQIFLYSLLLIVPGIICAIKHSQIINVLIDHPELSPSECILQSHIIMNNNKAKFFWLEASYFVWVILANIPSFFYTVMNCPNLRSFTVPTGMSIEEMERTMDAINEEIGVAQSHPIYILLSLLPVVVTVFIGFSKAAFYDLANGNIIFGTEEEVGYIDYEQ